MTAFPTGFCSPRGKLAEGSIPEGDPPASEERSPRCRGQGLLCPPLLTVWAHSSPKGLASPPSHEPGEELLARFSTAWQVNQVSLPPMPDLQGIRVGEGTGDMPGARGRST